MRTKMLVSAVTVVALLAPQVGTSSASPVQMDPCLLDQSSTHDHARTAGHGSNTCGIKRIAEIEVSKSAGLGQVEIHKGIAAVVGRDEGVVTLLDVKNPRSPKILGRYDDDIADSFDGDLAFSKDGNWLFYARQTHQFSKDGIHVLDVSNPKQPRLAFYQPQGGSFRIGYLHQDGEEYIVTMDAIVGLSINRFEPTTGALVPIYADALPALKVGGPNSAGVFIDPKDPKLGVPLAYATNGNNGLDVYDLSQPAQPVKVGAWRDVGLADVEVHATKGSRTIYAASEYWFNANNHASVYKLDATKLDRIKRKTTLKLRTDGAEPWRVGGLELQGGHLYAAEAHEGMTVRSSNGALVGRYYVPRAVNKNSALKAAPYAMDVDSAGGLTYLTDASSGVLTILKRR